MSDTKSHTSGPGSNTLSALVCKQRKPKKVHSSNTPPKVVLNAVDIGGGLTAFIIEVHPVEGTDNEKRLYLYNCGPRTEKACKNLTVALGKLCPKQENRYILNGIIISNPLPESYGGLAYLLENQLLAPDTPVVVSNDFDLKVQPFDMNLRSYLTTTTSDGFSGGAKGLKLHFDENASQKWFKTALDRHEFDAMSPSSSHEAKDGSILLQVTSNCPSSLLTGSSPGHRFDWLFPPNDLVPLKLFQVPQNLSDPSLPKSIAESLPTRQELVKASHILALYRRRADFQKLLPDVTSRLVSANGLILDSLDECLRSPPKSITHNSGLGAILRDNDKLIGNIESELNKDILVLVAEEQRDELQKLHFVLRVLEWAHFYFHLEADLYIFPALNCHEASKMEMMCGISIGCTWRRSTCYIALTHSDGLQKCKVFPKLVQDVTLKSKPKIWCPKAIGPADYPGLDTDFFTIDTCCDEEILDPDDNVILISHSSHKVEAGKNFLTLCFKDFVPLELPVRKAKKIVAPDKESDIATGKVSVTRHMKPPKVAPKPIRKTISEKTSINGDAKVPVEKENGDILAPNPAMEIGAITDDKLKQTEHSAEPGELPEANAPLSLHESNIDSHHIPDSIVNGDPSPPVEPATTVHENESSQTDKQPATTNNTSTSPPVEPATTVYENESSQTDEQPATTNNTSTSSVSVSLTVARNGLTNEQHQWTEGLSEKSQAKEANTILTTRKRPRESTEKLPNSIDVSSVSSFEASLSIENMMDTNHKNESLQPSSVSSDHPSHITNGSDKSVLGEPSKQCTTTHDSEQNQDSKDNFRATTSDDGLEPLPLTKQTSVDNSPVSLDAFFSCISYTRPGTDSPTLQDILTCFTNTLVISRLITQLEKEQSKLTDVLGPALKWKVDPNSSTFVLTATKTAAVSAKLKLVVPHQAIKAIHAVAVIVDNIRSAEVVAQVKVAGGETSVEDYEQSITELKIPSHFFDGSHGQTPADYLYHLNKSSWQQATHLTVEDTLCLLFGKEDACKLIKAFPRFLISLVLKWRIVHYLTTVSVGDQENEAHIYASPSSKTNIVCDKLVTGFNLRMIGIHVQFQQASLPSIDFEGECVVGENFSGHIAFSNHLNEVHVTFKCHSPQAIFDLIGLEYKPTDLTFPVTDLTPPEANFECKTGFVLSQPQDSTSTTITTLSISFKAHKDILQKWLPDTIVSKVEEINASALVQSLFSKNRITGLRVQFTLNVPVCTLNCILKVVPPHPDATEYLYQIDLLPVFLPSSGTVNSTSLIDSLSYFDSSGTKPFSEMSALGSLGDRLLKAFVIKHMTLAMSSNKTVKCACFEASMSDLTLFSEKVTVKECKVKGSYERENGVALECSGHLMLFNTCSISTEFSLPTSKDDGKFHFKNSESSLTLETLMTGFGMLPANIQTYPILNSFLDVAVKDVTLAFTRLDNDVQIKTAAISMSKRKLDLSVLKLQDIDLSVTIQKNNETDSYQVEFEGKCIVGNDWRGHISFSNVTQEVHVSFYCPSPQSLCDIVGTKYKATDMSFPMIGTELESRTKQGKGFECKAGIIFSFSSDSKSSISLMSFAINADKECLQEWLPDNVAGKVEGVEASAIIKSPFCEDRKTGLSVQFMLSFPVFTLKGVLKVIPPEPEATEYLYQINLLPEFSPKAVEADAGSVLDSIASFDSTNGKPFSEMSNLCGLGDRLLKAITIQQMTLTMSSEQTVKDACFKATLSSLPLFSGKVVISRCKVKGTYGESGLTLECSGHLTLFSDFSTSTQLSLPTSEANGKCHFSNTNTSLTLERLITEFDMLPDTNEFLSKFLDITVKEVNITIIRTDSGMQIPSAIVDVFKKELDISIIKVKDISLKVTVSKTDKSTSHKVELEGKCTVSNGGNGGNGQLSFSSVTKEVNVSYNCPSPESLGDLPFPVEMSELCELGDHLFKAVTIQEISLTVTTTFSLKSASFEASLSNLPLFSEKVIVTECKVKGSYDQENGLTLECSGHLTLFKKYSTFTELTLPTSKADGKFHFKNSDSGLTLMTLLSGFDMLPEDFHSNQVLTEFIDIALKEVNIILCRSDNSIQIKRAAVQLFKKELDISIVKIRDIDLTITVQKIDDPDSYQVEFEGNCIVGNDWRGHISFSSVTQEVQVSFYCPSPQSLCDIVGTKYKATDMSFPVIGTELESRTKQEKGFECKAGIIFSLKRDSKSSITLLSFAINADKEFLQEWLPDNVAGKVEGVEASAIIKSPFCEDRKTGLSVQFMLSFPVFTLKGVLKVIPPTPDATEYLYQINLLPEFSPKAVTADTGSVLDSVASFDSTDAKPFSEMSDLCGLGDRLLKAITIQQMTLTMSSKQTVKDACFKATLSSLPLFSGKVVISRCKVKGTYGESGLTLECSGHLTLFSDFSTSSQLSLPTSEANGKCHFLNTNTSLTLERLITEFDMLPDGISTDEFLSSFLDISVKEVNITISRTDSGMQIPSAIVDVFKKELDMSIIKVKDISLKIEVSMIDESTSHKVELEGKCTVSNGGNGQLSFSSVTKEVNVSYNCPSPESLGDLPFPVEISELCELGDHLFKAVTIQEISLTVTTTFSLKSASFEASLSNLPLFSEKVIVTECKVKGSYDQENGLTLECSGHLMLFKAYSTFTELTLPTCKADGKFHFKNSDSCLTLMTLLSGFDMLPEDFHSNQVLTEFIDIALKEVNIILCRSDNSIQIKRAAVQLFKKELDISIVKIRDIDLTITVQKIDDPDSYQVEFEGNCIVGNDWRGHISFSSVTQEVHVSFYCPSPQSLCDIVGTKYKATDMSFPVIGTELDVCTKEEGFECKAGFVYSLSNVSPSSITTLSFAIKTDREVLQKWLPDNVSEKIEHFEGFALIQAPFSKSRKTGLSVKFQLNFPVCTLNGVLKVIPPQPDATEYLCQINLLPVFSTLPNGADSVSVLEAISDFDTAVGNPLSEMSDLDGLGDHLLKAIVVQQMTLTTTSNRKLKSACFEALISNLPLFSEKVIITECKVKGTYGENGLTLECLGNLTLFKAYSTSTELSLPTSQADGKFHFENFDSSLTLEKLATGFEMLPSDICSNPILTKFLDIFVKQVHIKLGKSKDGIQVSGAVVTMYRKELDISVVKLHEINLTLTITKVDGECRFHFQIKAHIGESLYAQLTYDSASSTLTGDVQVSLFGGVSAPEALKAFEIKADGSSVNNYEDLTGVLQNHFMKVFASGSNEQSLPGMTGSLKITISVPPKVSSFDKYSLSYLRLQVKDVMAIRNVALKSFFFEYSKTPLSEETSSKIRLTATLSKLNSEECSMVEFNLASKRNESSILTAQLHAGPGGGIIKLSSVIEFAGCGKPALPSTEIPPIFDIELVDGSMISFISSPFKLHAIDVKVRVSEWMVFDDPMLTIHDLEFRLKWTYGQPKELTFTGHLTFINLFLVLNGVISAEEILVECKQQLKQDLEFQTALTEYTSNSSQEFKVPLDVGLPPVIVNLKELKLHLQKQSKLFHFNGQLAARHDCWQLAFGAKSIQVNSIGAVLEWEKALNRSVEYRAFIYGTMTLLDLQVDIQMQLGKGVDCIIAGMIHKPDNLNYETLAGYLTSPSEDSSSDGCSFSELVPSGIEEVSGVKAAAALNITKKQFFISGEIHHFGSASLFIGRLPKDDKMNYLLQLSLNPGFKFSMLSQDLAFIDEAVTVHNVSLLVSTLSVCTLSDVLKPYENAFTHLALNLRPNQPLKSLPGVLSNTKLMNSEIKRGTTIYAEIDIPACKRSDSLLYNVFRIGGESSKGPDIIVTAMVTEAPIENQGSKTSSDETRLVPATSKSSSATSKQFELKAWISEITLVRIIKFSDIELAFQLPQKNLSLSGDVLVDFDYGKLHFHGDLKITRVEASFVVSPANPCRDVISKPAGIDIIVRDLQLELQFDLTQSPVKAPIITISGEIDFSRIIVLKAFVLLLGLSFKVFHISLARGIHLSLLFGKSNIDWPVSSLEITIESGEFYYATTAIAHKGVSYEDGFHMEAIICFINSRFRVGASVSSDRKKIRIWGQSMSKINLFFAKLTSDDFEYGPMLEYSSQDSEPRLTVRGGVEILGWRALKGSISYLPRSKAFEGEITYPGKILFIDHPTLQVRWSEQNGFEVVDFKINGGSCFNLLKAVQTFAKIIYNLVTGLLRWNMKFNLKTTHNDDKNKYLVKFVITGSVGVTVLGFLDFDLDLPEIPINILRIKNFQFSELPSFILRCLWDSAGELCMNLLKYLNPIELAKKMGKMIINAITGAVTKVVDLAKKVGRGIKKVWNFFFGGSVFVLDEENNVIGYVYAGKDDRPLLNEEYIVKHFGPFLVVSGIGEMAADISTSGKACLDVSDDVKEDVNLSREVNRETLGEFKTKSRKVAKDLQKTAHDMLSALDIEINISHESQLQISWQVGTQDGDVVYDEDQGDIDHHIVVMATIIESVSSYRLDPCVRTETIFSEVISRPEDMTEQWPHCSVNIDTDVLQSAICICVSVHPTVTMRVKAIPSGDSIHVKQEWIETGDKEWMDDAHKRIDEEGRQKEVTLSGKLQYKEMITKPSSTHHDNFKHLAQCNFQELTISGQISASSHTPWYIIEVADTNNQAVVITRKLIKSKPSTHDTSQITDTEETDSAQVEQEVVLFNIDLPEFSDPAEAPLEIQNSEGPFMLNCIGLDKDLRTTPRFEISKEEFLLTRHAAPNYVTLEFPKSDKYDVNDTIKVTWSPSETDLSQMGEYTFYLVGSQPITQEEADDTTDSVYTEMSTLLILKDFVYPTSNDSDSTPYCSYEFSLKEVLRLKGSNIDLTKPLTLVCSVCTSGDKERLPSLLTKATDITIIATPAKLVCSLPKNKGGLLVSWPYSAHALSYRFEFINNSNSEVALPRPNDYHHKKTKTSRIKGCDVDHCISFQDLRHLTHNGSDGYSLQIHALGFGDEIMRSPFPTQAKEKIHVLPVSIKHVPETGTIVVNFDLHSFKSETDYIVELYQCSEYNRFKLVGSVVRPPSSRVIFTKDQWMTNQVQYPKSRPYTITGWVAAKAPVTSDTPGEICLPFGASSNELQMLPSPKELMVETSLMSHSAEVCSWNIQWTGTDYQLLKYEYGLCTANGEIVLSQATTPNKAAIITPSSVTIAKPSSIVMLKCFVGHITVSDEESTVPSRKLLSHDTYYLVYKRRSQLKVLSSVSLSQLLTYHFSTAVLQPSPLQLNPDKSKYLILPSLLSFPKVTKEAESGFWCPNQGGQEEEKYFNAHTLPTNGYLYAYNLTERHNPVPFGSEILSVKSKEMSFTGTQLAKLASVPFARCSKIHILFYSRCIELLKSKKEGWLKVKATLKIKRPTLEKACSNVKASFVELSADCELLTDSAVDPSTSPIETSVDIDPLPERKGTHGIDRFEDNFTEDAFTQSSAVHGTTSDSYREDSPEQTGSPPDDKDSFVMVSQNPLPDPSEQGVAQPSKVTETDLDSFTQTAPGSKSSQGPGKSSTGLFSNVGGFFTGAKSLISTGASKIAGIMVPSLSSQKTEQVMTEKELEVKLTRLPNQVEFSTEKIVVLLEAVSFNDLNDCSLTIHLSGENCRNEDIGLFVRYT